MGARWAALAVILSAVFSRADEAPPSVGPDLRELMAARNYGMAGAFNAMGYGSEAIVGNPAALAIYKRYLIEASAAWDPPSGFGYGTLALADSTSFIAAGVSYQFVTYGGADNRRWGHLTTLALAMSIADWLHIGLSGRHQVLTGATDTNSITMSAGVVLRPFNWLNIGASAQNFIDNFNPDITRYFVFSASTLLFDQLSPAFDLRMDVNGPTPRFAFHGGVEWLIAKMIPLRTGYVYDGIGNHQYLSFGAGYFNEGSGVDIAYRHELGGGPGRLLAITLKLQLGGG